MLQLVLVSCVSGTSRKKTCPQEKKQRSANLFCNWSAWNSPSLLVQLWCHFEATMLCLLRLRYSWNKKQHRWNSDWKSYIFHATPGSWQGRSAKPEGQLVIMTSLDLSSASWHPCQIMAARVDNIKYMKHFDVSSLCFCLFQNPGMTIFPNSVI